MTKTESPLKTIAKKAAGKAAADLIHDGMLVGLGSGSTTAFFIEALGIRCQQGLKISAIAASDISTQQAKSLGIPLLNNQELTGVDITVDGADEIDHHKNMIKGGGGALLREKLLARSSHEMLVIVDETKLVDHLGAAAVPVEIVPFIYQTTLLRLENQGYQGVLRLNRDGSFYRTDNGNYIVDIQFQDPILDPEVEHDLLKRILGVVETGLFFNVAGRVIVGYVDGFVKIRA